MMSWLSRRIAIHRMRVCAPQHVVPSEHNYHNQNEIITCRPAVIVRDGSGGAGGGQDEDEGGEKGLAAFRTT